MSQLEQWIATGKIARFVTGELVAEEHAAVFEAAKADPEVRAAIIAAKEAIMTHVVGEAARQDPQVLIASGLLEGYALDTISPAQRQQVEVMAMAHPAVSAAMDLIKRRMVDERMAQVAGIDADEYIASGILEDYVLGECSPPQALEVELAAAKVPAIGEELAGLRELHAQLSALVQVRPPVAAKQRFGAFLDASAMPADGWGLVVPPLSPASQAADYQPWLKRVKADAIDPAQDLNVIPLDASPEALTLYIVAKGLVPEETHLDAIERFLVLEGTCYIAMNGEQHHLKAGDYFRIPKFTTHTIVVTSAVPCRLIAQQIAA